MNAFPDDYVAHNLPLIVLCGLGGETKHEDVLQGNPGQLLREGGFRIRVDLPAVVTETALVLQQSLLSFDNYNKSWHGYGSRRFDENGMFRIQSVGRTYTLPPRKAPPPAYSPRLRPTSELETPLPPKILHSTISPLTPSSPLYPDGIMTQWWITKHQSRLPSMFIAFFTLVSDPAISTLQDNKVKSEINNVRSVLLGTNYKTKLVVVLVGDGYVETQEVDERLGNIRRTTSLDAKNLFYLAAGTSRDTVQEFSRGLLNGLYPGCVEYYRELSKHARRKRNRSSIPQPTVQPILGTSQVLPLSGWNVRYEFKLGVLAEFRQEMEAALRNYETAYDNLFSPEILESIPYWSPRFNEARLLADVVAIRSIRCLLWSGQAAPAIRWWTNHRNRIHGLIEKRGAGTETYGWEAWQSIWYKTMSNLVHDAQLFSSATDANNESTMWTLFLDAEKSLTTGQRYSPWENLHHEGYWLSLAQEKIQRRRARALEMPEEDRMPPGQSPASIVSSKAHLYDKYLVLEPHEEIPINGKGGYKYSEDIISNLDTAIEQFSKREQIRRTEILQLKKASEFIRLQQWNDAIPILTSAWRSQSWRGAGWWILLKQVGAALAICTTESKRHDLMLDVSWQLAHPVLCQQTTAYEIKNESEIVDEESTARIVLDAKHSLTRFASNFVFAGAEGHVGESIDAQLTIQCLNNTDVPGTHLRQLKIMFEGGLKSIVLFHTDSEDKAVDSRSVVISEVALEELTTSTKSSSVRTSGLADTSVVCAGTNLAFCPGQCKVFHMKVTPREAGEVTVASIATDLDQSKRKLTILNTEVATEFTVWWEIRGGSPTARPFGRDRDASTLVVLPKPPKVEIDLPDLRQIYYSNEPIELKIRSKNSEDSSVLGTIEACLISPRKNNIRLKWKSFESEVLEEIPGVNTSIQRLAPQKFGETEVDNTMEHVLLLDSTDEAIDHKIEIVLHYVLTSSPETKLSKTVTIDIPVMQPFKLNFTFNAQVHNEGWPNFFSPSTISRGPETPTGIKQKFLVTATMISLALEDLVVEATNLKAERVIGGASYAVSKKSHTSKTNDQAFLEEQSSILIHSDETKHFEFDIILQKHDLGETDPVAVDLLLDVRWTRAGTSDGVVTTTFAVPRLLTASAEPRVLVQSSKNDHITGFYNLRYTIENPSMHFLTFNVTMSSNDEFAFSGAKSKSISLVPISRQSFQYQIVSNRRQSWIKVHLEVVDAYFGKTLRVQPASEGIRADKQGNIMLWVDEMI